MIARQPLMDMLTIELETYTRPTGRYYLPNRFTVDFATQRLLPPVHAPRKQSPPPAAVRNGNIYTLSQGEDSSRKRNFLAFIDTEISSGH